MRRSGESEAVKADNDEPDEDSSGSETPVGMPAQTPSRPYRVWLKVEPPKRRYPANPPHISHSTWIRISRQIAAFMRGRLNNNVTLRALVRAAAAEMRLAGASADDVLDALRRAVVEHPELSTLDRTNVVTRRLASEELLDRMLKWANEVGGAEGRGR